jgi:protein-L-isoaspartate(D-aspartate) O-methyltransferase
VAHLDLIRSIHVSTTRNYLQRVIDFPKAQCATVAKHFGRDYFDGERQYGYGGYRYIEGRWQPLVDGLTRQYGLEAGQRVLDVGSGKGFLLHDLRRTIPGLEVAGLEISPYAIEHTMEDVVPFVQLGNATSLPYADHSFDLVVSINTLHNLRIYDLVVALREIERVGRRHKYVVVDGYRTEEEKANLMYWQITCECFYTPQEWEWIFGQAGYTGDYECIFYN